MQAREGVIATNAYTKGVTPWFRQRMIPSRAFMAATEPLDPALIHRLLPSHRTYVDYSRHMFNFWREAPYDDIPFRLTPNVLGYPWYLPVLTGWARIQDARGIAASGH